MQNPEDVKANANNPIDLSQTNNVDVVAKLDRSVYDALLQLAESRGVSANTVLQQAISTEKLLSDNISPNDKLLIKKPNDSYFIVNFAKAS